MLGVSPKSAPTTTIAIDGVSVPAPEPRAPPRARSGRDHEIRTIASSFLQMRPFIVGPYLLTQWFVIAASGARKAQLMVLGISNALLLMLFLYEAFRVRRGPVTSVWIFRSCAATLLAIGFACLGTGSTASPMLPMMFAPVGVTFAVFGRTKQSAWLLALLIGLGFLLAIATPHTKFLAVPSPHREIAMSFAILAAALLLYLGVAALTAAHRRAADALADQGDEAIRATESRLREWESQGAQIAHEMNNPLAAVQSLLEVMLETAEGRDQTRLRVARGELVRLSGIVDGYRSLATAAPFQSITRAPVNVDALLYGLVMILDARAAQNGVSLSFELPTLAGAVPAPSRELTCMPLDRDRVKEALINLVQNALQASAPGGTIRLSRTLFPHRQRLHIRVTDSGKGMSPEVLEKLGTPYFSQRLGGTGLGVTLARKVAEQHGGTLSYESVPGLGTTATLELSIAIESENR
jgi:signal transduction histidine kinase